MSKRLILLTSVLVLFLAYTAGAQPTGQILFEYWFDIGGTAISDLTNIPAYPDSPDDSELRDSLDGPVDWQDNYGSRARGYLYPPADGDYTFWIAGDDYQELYLSTDDDPANAVMIAEVPGWTNHLEWGKYPEQQSAPITLVGGQKYYIESLMKEGGGGDSMAVGWIGPEIGDTTTVIAGDYLSPVLRPAARKPVPADGTIDYDGGSLEWESGDGAVSHKVYLSTDAAIDDADLATETDLTIYLAALDPGMEYYWRVDEVDADGAVTEGKVWSFTTLPLEAHFPSPANGAIDIESGTTLSWTGGKGVIMHDVYFGTDEALVASGDPSTFKGKVMVTSYDPGPLELFTTYYWKVDEFSVTGTNAGPVWSFSTPGYIIIKSGDTTLTYDNTVDPFVSEIALDVPADLRFGGVGDLTFSFQGAANSGVSLDEATGTYMITGNGHDIWDNADDFTYGYRELTGDATIVARVVDNGTGSSGWAKGGVMIRQSLDAGSAHSYMPITGGDGNGASFQGRPVADGSSINSDSTSAVAPPYWVKLERVGNDFTGSISPDGVTWTQLGGVNTVEMTDPVLIGLAVTSHATGELRTFTFDNVDIEGDVSAEDMSADVGDDPAGNDPAPIYVRLEDSTGATATVTHGNPAATNITTPRQWTIPLDKFEGVDATSAAKLYIGVGDGQPDGKGSVTLTDIFVVKPTYDIVLVSGNHDFNADGVVDDFMLRDILEADGHRINYEPGNWTELDAGKIATLNAADLVIISRCTNSSDYAADETEITQWNSITTPMINCSTHLLRSSRWLWVDSTSILTLAPEVMELADGTQIDALDETIGMSSFIDAAPGNGTILATGDGLPWIIEWEAGVEYYDGSGQIAGGPRVFFVAGTQEAEGVSNWGEWNLTPAGTELYLDFVDRFAPGKDVTKPGDIVKGVPDDGDWPGAEYPALAIDDNVNTKYLHFKGDFDPDPGTGGAGIKITPLDGPTVVTGLTFTTANDVPGRDPIAFELAGSNDSIDGPYELIAKGDIVDFAMEAEWPRFTKNATPIKFDNTKAYSHYELIFTAIRGPVGGSVNSMQIAEVELIGVPAAEAPAPAGAGELTAAFAFGSRALECPTYNDPSVNYTIVLHESPGSVEYDPARGYGYEVLYPTDSPYGDRSGYGVFGPFDDSPNGRNEFPDECPEELYDSFIGAKNFIDECSAAIMGDMDTPCDVPEGIIFRVDVPNGKYRFVGAFGEADNRHAHRILAEDGGSGPPENIGSNYVVLVSNHDQAQYDIGEIANDDPGDAVFARVGFDGLIPPPGDGIPPSPVFVDMDENGMPTEAGANSPVLEVTQGYIRIHQLQGNSNDGPGGTRDANGGDIVILELWKVE